MKVLFTTLALTIAIAGYAQQLKVVTPHVKLGTIQGNHLEDGRVVRPQISAAEILANPTIVVDSPGWKVMEYKCSMMSDDKQYWGPFVIAGPKLDPRIIDHVKSPEFKKGRMFIENIRLENSQGHKVVTNNIIIDYSN
jgi:hypothetical protein